MAQDYLLDTSTIVQSPAVVRTAECADTAIAKFERFIHLEKPKLV